MAGQASPHSWFPIGSEMWAGPPIPAAATSSTPPHANEIKALVNPRDWSRGTTHSPPPPQMTSSPSQTLTRVCTDAGERLAGQSTVAGGGSGEGASIQTPIPTAESPVQLKAGAPRGLWGSAQGVPYTLFPHWLAAPACK